MPLLFEIEEEQTVSTPQIEVKNGDLWQLGEHRLLCGDCTVKENIDLLMNSNKADMVFTDPPYGINIVAKNGQVGGGKLAKNQIYMPIKNDDTIDTAKNFYELIKDCKKILLWGGVIIFYLFYLMVIG